MSFKCLSTFRNYTVFAALYCIMHTSTNKIGKKNFYSRFLYFCQLLCLTMSSWRKFVGKQDIIQDESDERMNRVGWKFRKCEIKRIL